MDALVAGKFVVLGGPLGGLAHDPWDAADLLRVERVARWTILLDDREAERGAS